MNLEDTVRKNLNKHGHQFDLFKNPLFKLTLDYQINVRAGINMPGRIYYEDNKRAMDTSNNITNIDVILGIYLRHNKSYLPILNF